MTREGDDLTIVAIGKMVAVAEETAEKLAEDQVSVEVIDLRSVCMGSRNSFRFCEENGSPNCY